ncbi:MAG: Nif11-like leader peptide family natural product precursor [Ruminiclostridium sp.]|nr:Nif11-like leader peptide family natural product precursor [Ruminiclostridium sp.]
MSKEIAKKLMAELGTNEELRAKVKGVTDTEELLKIAVEAGYDVTMEDLTEIEKDLRKEQANKTDDKLSFDEIEEVAGGRYWRGDLAPDGHEMGCVISYHQSGYSRDNDQWCSSNYYCNGNSLDCAAFDDGRGYPIR